LDAAAKLSEHSFALMFYPILIHSRHSEPPQGSFGGHDGFISQPLTRAAPGPRRIPRWSAVGSQRVFDRAGSAIC